MNRQVIIATSTQSGLFTATVSIRIMRYARKEKVQQFCPVVNFILCQVRLLTSPLFDAVGQSGTIAVTTKHCNVDLSELSALVRLFV
jgi:hypothetical protein